VFGVSFCGSIAKELYKDKGVATQGLPQSSPFRVCKANSHLPLTVTPIQLLSIFHFATHQSPPETMPPSPPTPISPTLLRITKGLSLVRIATGAACFFAPQLTCSLHGYEVPIESALLVRMMGAREAINGGLLFDPEDDEAGDGGRR
jgi:hypothetical protein